VRAGKFEETRLQRLFSAFPGGWPGIALFLLRAVLAISFIIQGNFYLRESGEVGARAAGIAAIIIGALLLAGFITPVAGGLAALGAIGVAVSLLPAGAPTLFDSKPAIVFAVTMLVGIVVLGPGAYSLDARVFGRREIIIPPPRTRQ
jgi:uncharacterized membrane protein YphA (DoxX/SURF4 family)